MPSQLYLIPIPFYLGDEASLAVKSLESQRNDDLSLPRWTHDDLGEVRTPEILYRRLLTDQ